jgi:hypothetical protein
MRIQKAFAIFLGGIVLFSNGLTAKELPLERGRKEIAEKTGQNEPEPAKFIPEDGKRILDRANNNLYTLENSGIEDMEVQIEHSSVNRLVQQLQSMYIDADLQRKEIIRKSISILEDMVLTYQYSFSRGSLDFKINESKRTGDENFDLALDQSIQTFRSSMDGFLNIWKEFHLRRFFMYERGTVFTIDKKIDSGYEVLISNKEIDETGAEIPANSINQIARGGELKVTLDREYRIRAIVLETRDGMVKLIPDYDKAGEKLVLKSLQMKTTAAEQSIDMDIRISYETVEGFWLIRKLDMKVRTTNGFSNEEGEAEVLFKNWKLKNRD